MIDIDEGIKAQNASRLSDIMNFEIFCFQQKSLIISILSRPFKGQKLDFDIS